MKKFYLFFCLFSTLSAFSCDEVILKAFPHEKEIHLSKELCNDKIKLHDCYEFGRRLVSVGCLSEGIKYFKKGCEGGIITHVKNMKLLRLISSLNIGSFTKDVVLDLKRHAFGLINT